MRACLAVVVVAACGKSGSTASHGEGAAAGSDPWAVRDAGAAHDASTACEPLPFAKSISIAEASGGALVDVDGTRSLIVVADSDNHGAYALLDPDTGVVREHGLLPLPDGVSDDLEGIASPDAQTVYGLVSDGTLITWKRAGTTYALVESHRIEEARGKNYEGLCLSPSPRAGECDGYAASKAEGRLWCLRDLHDLHVDPSPARSIAVGQPEQLADCSYAPDGRTLLVGGNLFAENMVTQIDVATGATHDLGPLGAGNGEVVVVGPDGIVYRFSDLNAAPSLAGKFRCPLGAR